MENARGKLKALLALWHQKRSERFMPLRADLPVQALHPWLGNLALIDLRDGNIIFRLCGTALHGRFGGEMTRKDIKTLDAEVVGALRRCIEQVQSA